MRYPDKFHIQNVIETREGSDYVYENDETREPFIFIGRIREVSPDASSKLVGDLSKATHTINCSIIDFDVRIGLTIYDYNSEKDYEVLLPIVGQKGMKIWVAQS